jgi:hypothetical protein
LLSFVFGGGCGLISNDVTQFDLQDNKSFAIDTAAWQVNSSQAQTFLSTSCASAPMVCGAAAQQACGMNCTGTCDATSHTCDLSLAVSIYQLVDLQNDNSGLSQIKNEPVIKVAIDSVTYDITTNTLNVATPPLTVFVAPMSVTNASDPMALAVGTVAAVPAGMTSTANAMTYTDGGKQNLINIMSTYKNPFNILVGGTLTVTSGTPVPTGMLGATVHIHATASL